VAGHEHDVHCGAQLHQGEQIHRCAVGELQVGDEQVEVLLLQRTARGLERGGGARREALALDERLHSFEMGRLIVHEQRARRDRLRRGTLRRHAGPS